MPSNKLVASVIAAVVGTFGAVHVASQISRNERSLIESYSEWHRTWHAAAVHHGLYPTPDTDHIMAGLKAGPTYTHPGLPLEDAREAACVYLRAYSNATRGAWGLYRPTKYLNDHGYAEAFNVAVCTAPMMADRWLDSKYCNQTMRGIDFTWGVVAAVLESVDHTLCFNVLDDCFNAVSFTPWPEKMAVRLKVKIKMGLDDVERVVDDKGKQTVHSVRSRWDL